MKPGRLDRPGIHPVKGNPSGVDRIVLSIRSGAEQSAYQITNGPSQVREMIICMGIFLVNDPGGVFSGY